MRKIIYYGVFFDEEESKKLYKLDKKPLEKIAKDLHVTFRYFPFPNERINDVVGKEISLKVIGYGNNEKNSALLVEVPSEFKKYYRHRFKKDGNVIFIVPHITLSLSNDSTPKESRDLNFARLNNPITITGRFGYFVSDLIDNEKKTSIVYEEVL